MKRLLRSLFQKPQLNKLNICENHITKDQSGKVIASINQALPYSMDYCKTCDKHICLACSETHVIGHCEVSLGINKQLGGGVLRNLNLGEVIKVDLQNLKCICGKTLGKGSAICAACGLASCSQSCHKEWQKAGNCKFSQNFYSIPEGFTMRSILFDNIYGIQKSNAKQWIISNRSSTSMLCCYAHSKHPFVFFQRGYKNYGTPNPQFILKMQTTPRALDYYIHYERRCDCNCFSCQNQEIHSATNCQSSCRHFDYAEVMIQAGKSQNHKQCSCTCKFCQSGIIFNTHRYVDCLPFCQRSTIKKKFIF